MTIQPDIPTETDIVIVGGGVIGTSIGYFLTTETDLNVTLLERDAIAAGSTGDSSAIIRHHYGDREIYTRMARRSHEFYREFETEVGASIAYEENPRVVFAEEGSEDAEYAISGYDILSEHDIPVQKLDSEEAEERFPMLRYEDADFAVSDETAAYSDGIDVAAGFARAMADRGATVATGTTVEGFAIENDRIVGVRTGDTCVRCDRVVVAAGPWTQRLMDEVGVDLPLVSEREQIIILDPPHEFIEIERIPTAGLPGGYYMRPDFGEGVLVATHHSGEEVDPNTYDNQLDEETLLHLHETVATHVPKLEDAGIKGSYCGVYASTPDHDFIIDECGPDGCYIACGFSGHGFKNAPAVGQLVTDLLTDADSTLVDPEHFSLSRFASATDENGSHEY